MSDEIVAEGEGEAQHITKYIALYSDGVLKPDVHRRLVEEMQTVVRDSGIPEAYICKTAVGVCTEQELLWVKQWKQYRERGIVGLYYIGGRSVRTRILSLGGVFIRNFVSVRMLTVQEVLRLVKDGQSIDNTVVMVSNFFYPKDQGGDIASWQVSVLLGWLYERQTRGLITVLGIDNLSDLQMQYGVPFHDLLQDSYLGIGG